MTYCVISLLYYKLMAYDKPYPHQDHCCHQVIRNHGTEQKFCRPRWPGDPEPGFMHELA